jgi:ribonuclease-3
MKGDMDNGGGSQYNLINRLVSAGDVEETLRKFGVTMRFKSLALYRKAFIHRSYCVRKNENIVDGNRLCPEGCLPLQEESQERIEFLGDAVINLVVADYLYKRYPDENEGFLTRIRSKLVNGNMLAHLSHIAGFDRFLVMSAQIEANGGRNSTKLMEDAFEAFVAAMYLDFNSVRIKSEKIDSGIGYQVAERWLINLLESNVDFTDLISNQESPKERLLRFMLTQNAAVPRFVVVEEGPESFTVAARRGEDVVGTGTGKTRKAAENAAATEALNYLGLLPRLHSCGIDV